MINKSLFLGLLLLTLFGCSSGDAESIEPWDEKEIESNLEDILVNADNNLEIQLAEEHEESYTMMIKPDFGYIVEDEKLYVVLDNPQSPFVSFGIDTLIKVSDISIDEQGLNQIKRDLGLLDEDVVLTDHTEVTSVEDISYSYMGTEEEIILRAEKK